VFTIIVAIGFTVGDKIPINGITIIIGLILIFLVGGGVNVVLFIRYWLYTKDKMLIMSKANEVFYFGKNDNPVKYKKSDIVQFSTVRMRNSKHTLSFFALVTIDMANGEELAVPNIMIDHLALENKLSGIPHIEINRLPGVKL